VLNCPALNTALVEEALADKFFQVLSTASTMDGLVPFTVVIRTIFFRSEECRVVLDRLRALYPWLVLGGLKTLLIGRLSRVKCFSILKAWSGFDERTENVCLLYAGCP